MDFHVNIGEKQNGRLSWQRPYGSSHSTKHRAAVETVLPHCRPFISLLQKLFFTSDVNGLHETKDYVSCGSVILCFEDIVVTLEEFLLKFAALGQARQLA